VSEVVRREPQNLHDAQGVRGSSPLRPTGTGKEQVVRGGIPTFDAGFLGKRFWSWVRIRRVDDDGQVHFEHITAEEAARLVPADR
jgi:hypothetical protein